MADILSFLPEHARDGVVTYITEDDKVYGNMPAADAVDVFDPTTEPDIYVDDGGEEEIFPESESAPIGELAPTDFAGNDYFYTECRGGQGAYRRMLTKEGGQPSGPRGSPTRYGYISTLFNLEGSTTSTIRINNPDKDVAFAFLGGNGTNGFAVDAGMQYSPVYRNWALFIRTQGGAVRSQTDPAYRFAPNQQIAVEFFTVQNPSTIQDVDADGDRDNLIAVVAKGQRDIRGGGGPWDRTFVLDVASGGWPRDGYDAGNGINLKQTVSLAQAGTQTFTTGSYFRGTTITNTQVGASYASRRPLRSDDIAKVCEYPAIPADVINTSSSGAINIEY